jgi:hypothetical protein
MVKIFHKIIVLHAIYVKVELDIMTTAQKIMYLVEFMAFIQIK